VLPPAPLLKIQVASQCIMWPNCQSV